MTQYRRASVPGATWFFTVNLAERNGNRLLVDEVDALRAAIRAVQAVHSLDWPHSSFHAYLRRGMYDELGCSGG